MVLKRSRCKQVFQYSNNSLYLFLPRILHLLQCQLQSPLPPKFSMNFNFASISFKFLQAWVRAHCPCALFLGFNTKYQWKSLIFLLRSRRTEGKVPADAATTSALAAAAAAAAALRRAGPLRKRASPVEMIYTVTFVPLYGMLQGYKTALKGFF